MLKVQIVNKSNNEIPSYATILSAGMDLRANITCDWLEKEVMKFSYFSDKIDEKNNKIIIPSGKRLLIPTGLYIALPEGYEAQIRPRSGLALKYGISIVNTPGTVDADYRGEIGVIIINHGNEPFEIKNGDRICQMVVNKFEKIEWEEVDNLNDTERGNGGFGHTGK